MPNKLYRFEAGLTPAFPKTSGEETITDLGVIDGNRYLSATKSAEFSEEFEVVDLTTEEGESLKERIKRESPLCRQIDEDTIQNIRMKYDLNEELKALRTGDTEYCDFVQKIVRKGKKKKQKLGL